MSGEAVHRQVGFTQGCAHRQRAISHLMAQVKATSAVFNAPALFIKNSSSPPETLSPYTWLSATSLRARSDDHL